MLGWVAGRDRQARPQIADAVHLHTLVPLAGREIRLPGGDHGDLVLAGRKLVCELLGCAVRTADQRRIGVGRDEQSHSDDPPLLSGRRIDDGNPVVDQ